MPFYFWDPTMLLLIPAIILAVWAQTRVSSTYSKYSKISSARGTTGAETAKFLLQLNGLTDVNGQITDILSLVTSQPIVGRVRKSTTGILYQSSKILATIDNVSGLNLIIQLIPDE